MQKNDFFISMAKSQFFNFDSLQRKHFRINLELSIILKDYPSRYLIPHTLMFDEILYTVQVHYSTVMQCNDMYCTVLEEN